MKLGLVWSGSVLFKGGDGGDLRHLGVGFRFLFL